MQQEARCQNLGHGFSEASRRVEHHRVSQAPAARYAVAGHILVLAARVRVDPQATTESGYSMHADLHANGRLNAGDAPVAVVLRLRAYVLRSSAGYPAAGARS